MQILLDLVIQWVLIQVSVGLGICISNSSQIVLVDPVGLQTAACAAQATHQRDLVRMQSPWPFPKSKLLEAWEGARHFHDPLANAGGPS